MSTGALWHFPGGPNGTEGAAEFVGEGRSGNGDGLNNPLYQLEKDIGPIPEGDWTIGPLEETLTTNDGNELKWAMRLWPKSGTNTFGRRGFIIHGGIFSKGCPIFDEAIRKKIGNSGDKKWRVVR